MFKVVFIVSLNKLPRKWQKDNIFLWVTFQEHYNKLPFFDLWQAVIHLSNCLQNSLVEVFPFSHTHWMPEFRSATYSGATQHIELLSYLCLVIWQHVAQEVSADCLYSAAEATLACLCQDETGSSVVLGNAARGCKPFLPNILFSFVLYPGNSQLTRWAVNWLENRTRES